MIFTLLCRVDLTERKRQHLSLLFFRLFGLLDASSKRDTFSIRILATRLLPFMVNRNFDLFFPFRKKGLLVGSPCYLSLEKVHTMAFTIVAPAAHAGHQRCEVAFQGWPKEHETKEIIMMLLSLSKMQHG